MYQKEVNRMSDEQKVIEPIEGVNLADLVSEASIALIKDRRELATTAIKNYFHKLDGLTAEIKSLKNQLSKKEESQARVLEKIKKLKEGDWSVLKDNQGNKDQNSPQSPEPEN